MKNPLQTTKLHMDVGEFLEKSIPFITHKKRIAWNKQIKKWKRDFPLDYEQLSGEQLKTQCALIELNKQTINMNNIYLC